MALINNGPISVKNSLSRLTSDTMHSMAKGVRIISDHAVAIHRNVKNKASNLKKYLYNTILRIQEMVSLNWKFLQQSFSYIS